MVFMAPENIEVPTELNHFKDSIVNYYIEAFYNEKTRLQDVIKSNIEEYPEDMRKSFEEYKKNAEIQMKYMDSVALNIKNYKFYNTMLYSVSILNMYFYVIDSIPNITGIKYSAEVEGDFEGYCKRNNLDYFMFVDDFAICETGNSYTITSILKLYSLKEKKLIVEKVITGNTESHGDMWTCTDPLSCLMITSVKSVIETVVPEIKKRLR